MPGPAEHGFPVTASQAGLTAAKLGELGGAPSFAETFLIDGRPAKEIMTLPALGARLRRPGHHGIEDFIGASPAAISPGTVRGALIGSRLA